MTILSGGKITLEPTVRTNGVTGYWNGRIMGNARSVQAIMGNLTGVRLVALRDTRGNSQVVRSATNGQSNSKVVVNHLKMTLYFN